MVNFPAENQSSSVSLPEGLESAVLTAAIESATVGVAITDARLPDNPVIYINAAFTQITGYLPEDVIGVNCRFLQGEDTERKAVGRLREAIAAGQGCTETLCNYTKDGRPFWNELSIAPVFDAQGELAHFIGFQKDVTARVEVETRLREVLAEAERARAEADRANAAKSEFLSRMSHELRTPMNSVLGFAQLLEMDGLPEAQQERVDYILSAGRHLLSLIDEVLDLARVEAGRMVLHPEPVHLADIAEEAVAIVSPLAAVQQILVRVVEIPEDAVVLADQQRLQQILLNLLSNAVKYNRLRGSVEVRARTVALPNDEVGWRLEIADTGPGVPAEKRDRLFQPFERLGADASGVRGTGLGLALSRRLVEAMGGEMGLEPWQEGEGSTFWLTLRSATDGVSAGPAETSPPLEALVANQAKVLYIEDNVANFELVDAVLSRLSGVELMAAMQGRLGVEIAREHQPRLILLDLDLPDIPGEEVLKQLQADARTAKIPVFVVSADATPAQIMQLRQAGAQEYFTKPLDVRQFLAAVRDSLQASLLA